MKGAPLEIIAVVVEEVVVVVVAGRSRGRGRGGEDGRTVIKGAEGVAKNVRSGARNGSGAGSGSDAGNGSGAGSAVKVIVITVVVVFDVRLMRRSRWRTKSLELHSSTTPLIAAKSTMN